MLWQKQSACPPHVGSLALPPNAQRHASLSELVACPEGMKVNVSLSVSVSVSLVQGAPQLMPRGAGIGSSPCDLYRLSSHKLMNTHIFFP